MKSRVIGYLVALWPDQALRHRVAGEYAALRGSKHMLADIAIRNFVFAPSPDADNLFAAGVAEGRRRCALEIMALAKVDPNEVASVNMRLPNRGEGQ